MTGTGAGDPTPEQRAEQERAAAWVERHSDSRGRLSYRPPTRPYALVGVGLGLVAVVASAISGSPGPLVAAYLTAIVVGGLGLVLGLVLFVIGWATGPKGAFADHNAARRIGGHLLLVGVGGIVLLAVGLIGEQLLALLR